MGNNLAVENLIPEGVWCKGLKATDPVSERALLALLAGLGEPANFAAYDVPTLAACDRSLCLLHCSFNP